MGCGFQLVTPEFYSIQIKIFSRPIRSQTQFKRSPSLTTASRSRVCCRTSWSKTTSTARRPLSRQGISTFSTRIISRIWMWPGITHGTVIQNPSEAQRKEHDKFDFELHEVYAVDVLISTGEGQVRNQGRYATNSENIPSQFQLQGKERDSKVTVFKKTEETYMLKMKNSREFFSAVSTSFLFDDDFTVPTSRQLFFQLF